jgi:hypothetical protein
MKFLENYLTVGELKKSLQEVPDENKVIVEYWDVGVLCHLPVKAINTKVSLIREDVLDVADHTLSADEAKFDEEDWDEILSEPTTLVVLRAEWETPQR